LFGHLATHVEGNEIRINKTLLTQKVNLMTKTNILTLTGAVLLSSLIVGCASKSELEEVRALAVGAQQSADNAQATASNASKCCEMNRQSLERMYQKVMGK
jgi:hypothetical protein